MADNVQIDTGPSPDANVAADEIDGVFYQRVKLVSGADGVAQDVATAAPLPVVGVNHLVPHAFDQVLIDPPSRPTTITYKLAGSTVRTLTLTYSGPDVASVSAA